MTEPDTDPIYREALEWFVRIKDEQASAEDRRAFADWIAQGPAHEAAFQRAQKLWDRFEIVKPEYDRMRASGSLSRRTLLIGGLAGLAAASGGYLFTRPGLFADYTTDVAERRSFELADGSVVELGSYSALSVHYTNNERRLVLHRGEGFFRVAADAGRPFLVEAGIGTTRALGTQFNVKLADLVTVSVAEHSVSVALDDARAVTIEEGWQVSYGAAGLGAPQQADQGVIEAWRKDRIVFEDVPLRRVLSELERYRRGRIVLVDESIGNIPVTAIFETRQTEQALRTIAETLPIRVLNAAGFVAIVYRR